MAEITCKGAGKSAEVKKWMRNQRVRASVRVNLEAWRLDIFRTAAMARLNG